MQRFPNTITVSGINMPAAISVTGGEYQINGGNWSSVSGNVSNGDGVAVRHTSSADYSTSVSTELTIGGVSASFTTTTEARPSVAGACGADDQQTLLASPVNLCSAGIASAVTGDGHPWAWSCAGEHGGATASCSASIQTWNVTANANPTDGGSVSCSPNPVDHGSKSTCTTTANQGYRFDAWGDDCSGQTGASCTLASVDSDKTASVTFIATGSDLVLPEGPWQGEPLTVAPQAGSAWHLDSAATQTVASIGTPPPAGATLPHGLVALELSGGAANSDATVVLTYPRELAPGMRYYKFGSTGADPTPHWYVYPNAVFSGNTITLTLTDNADGDANPADSAIRDPGGPGLAASVAIPTFSQWAGLVLAALLGLLAVGALRRRSA